MNGSRDATSELTELRFVGEKTASVLAADGVQVSDIERKRVSFIQLVEAGVNPGVAARIRRAHSLSWSFESSGEDLERRSAQVRGLGEAERAWVAASSGDWEAASGEPTESSRGASSNPSPTAVSATSADDGAAETTWRDRRRPTPVTALTEVDAETAATLHEGGIGSVRRLATVHVARVADALELDEETVDQWREAARQHRR